VAPNILFIILDDLNAWIGALGRHPQVKTPNIDALARRGDLFARAYCSAPYCNASRMGLFTGRLPATLGVYDNEPFWDTPGRPPTFIELLRTRGYHTVGAGKVFHGVFDYQTALRERTAQVAWREIENREWLWDAYTTNVLEPLPENRPLNGLFDFSDLSSVPEKYRLFDWGPLSAEAEERTPDQRVANAVSEFLSAPKEPFFCAAGLYKPHLPWHAPQRFFDLYDRDSIHLPPVKDDDLDDVPPIACRWALDPPDHALVTSRGVWPDAVRGYLACISYADFMVGQILDALARSPAAGRTTVVLCGDNGYHLGEKLHWRKFALWEESTRVPLIVARPGQAARRILDPVSLIDIHATVLDLASLGGDPGDSESLLACAERPRSKPVITTWGAGNHSLRGPRWRYTRYSDSMEELYDHAVDSFEWTNLAAAPEFANARAELSAQIDAQCKRMP
jgi:arylsulfatase A-like enzyme